MIIETGISDFHKLVVTVLNTTLKRVNPRLLHIETIKDTIIYL